MTSTSAMAATTIPSTVRPAEPLTASNLVGVAELESLFDRVVGVNAWKEKERVGKLGTGIASVDKALRGGIEGGGLVGVGCEGDGDAGREICFALLTNSLLLHPTSTAAVIDTTGNFNIPRLYTQIVQRLQSDPSLLDTFPARTGTGDENATVEDLAAKVLERVKIMRVFDLVGVMEAVGEIREELEGTRTGIAPVSPPIELENYENEASPGVMEPSEPAVSPPRPRSAVIPDSEDEDEDMLFEEEANSSAQHESVHVETSVQPTFETTDPTTSTETHAVEPTNSPQVRDIQPNEEKTSFILIDNLAHVVTPLLKKDYIYTRAQTHTFLLSLTTLTTTHTLHTILLNPSQPPRRPTRPPTHHQQPPGPPPPHTTTTYTANPPSIFPSTTLVPCLADILVPFLDLHLLVARLPRGRNDARVAYADGVGGTSMRGRGGRFGAVVEVLKDRWGGRTVGWGWWV